MAGTYAIIMDSAGAIKDFDSLDKDVQTSIRIALNTGATRTRTMSAQAVRKEINLPASYVGPSSNRLSVSKTAKNGDLEAVISARRRNTSLARFVQGPARVGQAGARVMVKPGFATYMRKAMFIKLRAGGDDLDTRNNLGLAIRTGGGAKPSNAYHPVKMRNGLWLLYGPSVAQALLGLKNTGIWPNMTDEIEQNIINEYFRQLDLKGH